jgi:hypothetical protein
LKIYCDTSTLPHNIRNLDPKSQKELEAIRQLAETFSMFGSHLVSFEAERTPNKIDRDHLIVEAKGLKPVPKDEKVVGNNAQTLPFGGFIGFFLISDVQDEPLRQELMKRGLDQRDAEHITQAICNDCDVFLTRDERTIIRRHGQWLERRFPKLRVLMPSQLLELISAKGTTSTQPSA